MLTTHKQSRTAELWIRPSVPVSTTRCERALEGARDLEARGVLDAVEVGIWGRELASTTLSRRVPQLEAIHHRLEAFEEWASRTDRRLEPFFDRRRVESELTGQAYDRWRLPVVALVEFDGADLVHVAPCTDGDRTVDVFDRLETLAEAGFDGRDERPRDRSERGLDEVISPTVDLEAFDPDPRVEPSASGPN